MTEIGQNRLRQNLKNRKFYSKFGNVCNTVCNGICGAPEASFEEISWQSQAVECDSLDTLINKRYGTQFPRRYGNYLFRESCDLQIPTTDSVVRGGSIDSTGVKLFSAPFAMDIKPAPPSVVAWSTGTLPSSLSVPDLSSRKMSSTNCGDVTAYLKRKLAASDHSLNSDIIINYNAVVQELKKSQSQLEVQGQLKPSELIPPAVESTDSQDRSCDTCTCETTTVSDSTVKSNFKNAAEITAGVRSLVSKIPRPVRRFGSVKNNEAKSVVKPVQSEKNEDSTAETAPRKSSQIPRKNCEIVTVGRELCKRPAARHVSFNLMDASINSDTANGRQTTTKSTKSLRFLFLDGKVAVAEKITKTVQCANKLAMLYEERLLSPTVLRKVREALESEKIECLPLVAERCLNILPALSSPNSSTERTVPTAQTDTADTANLRQKNISEKIALLAKRFERMDSNGKDKI